MLFLLSKEDCLTPLFKPIYFMKSSSTLLKECHDLEQLMCIFKFCLRETFPLSEIALSLWKTYHICSKIYGKHGALFLKECCAHLRALLHTNDALSQRNVALSVALKSELILC